MTSTNPPPHSTEEVPWDRVVRFMRQLSHDLRNNLNAMELQSAYIGEIVEDAEVKDEVRRLRAMASDLGTRLQNVTAMMAPVNPQLMPYKIADFFEDLRAKLAARFPDEASAVDWQLEIPEGSFTIDPQLLQEAMLELFANAFRHGRGEGPLVAQVRTTEAALTFALAEPKTDAELDMEDWGRQPLRSARQGSYGLGLARVQAILAAHSGTLAASFDQGARQLTTTVTLPKISSIPVSK